MKKNVTLICVMMFTAAFTAAAGTLKGPNVAGGFYPDDPAQLARLVDGYIAKAPDLPVDAPVEMALAPHAGYAYSGAVAGVTYKALSKTAYRTIIIMAPSHYFPFPGVAIWPKGAMATPLGEVPVDEAFAAALMAKTAVIKENPQVFEKEHALEVQLPFIQRTFPKAKIVPLLFGEPDLNVCAAVAGALNSLIGGRRDVLVLISSDLSHYLPYDENNARDERTLGALRQGNIEAFWVGNLKRSMEMCGFVPATAGMMLAKMRGLSEVKVLRHANSGDSSGDRSRVVGYAAVVFVKPAGLMPGQKRALAAIARRSLDLFVKEGKKITTTSNDARFNEVQGAFVTLTEHGQLRGCVGNIIGTMPLSQTVADMAIAAASETRFPPVKPAELKDIRVEVSVLSVPRRIADINEITLGRDGVILSSPDGHQGVFLPQVATETGWSKEEFLSQLCSQKAGLAGDCYTRGDVAKYTFTAEVFDEE